MIKDDEEGVGKRKRNSKETREMKRRTSRESTCRGTAIWLGSPRTRNCGFNRNPLH